MQGFITKYYTRREKWFAQCPAKFYFCKNLTCIYVLNVRNAFLPRKVLRRLLKREILLGIVYWNRSHFGFFGKGAERITDRCLKKYNAMQVQKLNWQNKIRSFHLKLTLFLFQRKYGIASIQINCITLIYIVMLLHTDLWTSKVKTIIEDDTSFALPLYSNGGTIIIKTKYFKRIILLLSHSNAIFMFSNSKMLIANLTFLK